MLLTIIPSDSSVYRTRERLMCDFAGLEIPAMLHAFQWDGVKGELEFTEDSNGQKPVNTKVEALPAWALECDARFADAKMKEMERAVQEAARIARQQATLAAQAK